MTTVTLTTSEARAAALIGAERRIQSMHLPDNHGLQDADWDMDINGAAGEMAFAKLIGAYWACDIGTFKKPDLGDNIQVRTVPKDGLSLIIRNDDSNTDVYVLMVGSSPRFRYAGWIRGQDAKQDQWLRSPNGRPAAWFVPETALHTERRQAA